MKIKIMIFLMLTIIVSSSCCKEVETTDEMSFMEISAAIDANIKKEISFELGLKAYNEGDYEKAIEKFEGSYDDQSQKNKRYTPLCLIGFSFFNLGVQTALAENYDLAVEYFNSAKKYFNETITSIGKDFSENKTILANAYANKAKIALYTGKYMEASSNCENAVSWVKKAIEAKEKEDNEVLLQELQELQVKINKMLRQSSM